MEQWMIHASDKLPQGTGTRKNPEYQCEDFFDIEFVKRLCEKTSAQYTFQADWFYYLDIVASIPL